MTFAKVAVLALFLVPLVVAEQLTLEEADAFVFDDECNDDAEACALNAVQLRASRQQKEDWSVFGTTEQCCKCKSGTIGWSASGKCSFCSGGVAKTKSVSSDCTVKSKTFKGNTVCANSCQKSVLLEEPQAAMMQFLEKRKMELDLEAKAMAEDEAIAEDEWSVFGTTEQCCKCKSGTIGWSASGKCSFCSGSVAKTKSVSSDCTVKSKTFRGNTVCANSCQKSVLLEEPQAAMVQSLEERKKELDFEVKAMAEDEAIAEDEWSVFGTTEQCCKCKSGTIGWSATGKCSFCSGGVAKTKSVSSDCAVKSKTFRGNTACANSCQKSVLLEEHFSELQAAQESLAEDEALAEGQGEWIAAAGFGGGYGYRGGGYGYNSGGYYHGGGSGYNSGGYGGGYGYNSGGYNHGGGYTTVVHTGGGYYYR
jgi:hypothetical protein